MMSIQKQLESVTISCTEQQQQKGISLLLKIFKEALNCVQQNKPPKPVRIDIIVTKTNCYHFINILLSAGYNKTLNSKQLKLDTSKLEQLTVIYNEVTRFSDTSQLTITDRETSRSSSKRPKSKTKSKSKKSKSKTKTNTLRTPRSKSSNVENHVMTLRQQNSLRRSQKARPASLGFTRAVAPNATPTKLGPYCIRKLIGKGAYSQVYECVNAEKRFALKLFDKKLMKSEQNYSVQMETKILSTLSPHQNVIQLLDVVENDRFIGMVLPYYGSGSLLTLIRNFGIGNVPEIVVKAFVDQILKGLQFLHSNGIIHRDVKASNVLMDDDGIVKISDFGISVFYDAEIDTKLHGVGAPYWMAPELIEMTEITPKCDIWALGITAIELLTGSAPYGDLIPFSAMYHTVNDEHPPLPAKASPLFTDFLQQCLKKDPHQRPSASKLLRHKWLADIEYDDMM
mmetsp:Transcript_26032/g.42553  ORF Transcript_26032/g.42553 Transcript_26032/m.42553 type:complete len:455 (-) Transcript_26032:244-1608(-)|eukprot:CAMPEP_0202692118 /NCGR_PEP_ID=MMETSP1385-20130828/6584_1 /ASSEMBLY_ACC=CAM_ASM_000861 /TAXON_ID=933848 /ORGANISM="Elphidium margaritaceum" /LENGTH=454 /DNA_ID=CAMNT_0049347595 /DNA_START=112 /DNA_END=1476 /DNA_ORIENTATION=+